MTVGQLEIHKQADHHFRTTTGLGVMKFTSEPGVTHETTYAYFIHVVFGCRIKLKCNSDMINRTIIIPIIH